RFSKLLGQPVEQFRVGRLVVLVHVVHWIDDAAREEGMPHPVDGGLGEILVLRRCQPFGEHRPEWTLGVQSRLAALKELGLGDADSWARHGWRRNGDRASRNRSAATAKTSWPSLRPFRGSVFDDIAGLGWLVCLGRSGIVAHAAEEG